MLGGSWAAAKPQHAEKKAKAVENLQFSIFNNFQFSIFNLQWYCPFNYSLTPL